MISKEQFEAQAAVNKKEGFAKWKDEPMTRMVLSQLPPNESLNMVLRAAFEAGFNNGSGYGMLTVIQSIMKEPPR
jgi:hypothetical protein